jgi:hypothetical protein
MKYLITASKDASTYSLYPKKNTGLDPILTVGKTYTRNNDADNSRSYLYFKIDSLPGYVTSSNVELSLQITEVEQIPLNYTIIAYPVTESWEMGIGKYEDSPIYSSSINWETQPGINSSVSSSQIFEYEDSNIKMNINNLYNYWTQSFNYGLRLSHEIDVENSSLDYGTLKFYSKETNTYRQPLLIISWDDQVYTTGSLKSVADTNEIIIKSKGLKKEYPSGKIARFNFVTRDKFPVKTFSSTFAYENMQYLPQTSYYSIVDIITKIPIIEYSDYTKISCDGIGSYVLLDTTNFPKNRPLKFEFMINRNGKFELYEDDLSFEIK